MSTKTMVLEILEKNRQTDISGEHLANALKVTRAAIHKAIKELRQEGYEINAVTNKGYRLSEHSDILSAEGIKALLSEKIPLPDLFVYDTLPSTNQTAKQLALEGAKEGSVVLANTQTAGRGRMGKSFYSPPDSGIYMSIILRPNISAQMGGLITSFAAVAVCRTIEKAFGLFPKIKWVNDIFLNGKKVCGILTEAVTDFESGNVESVILGIGINLSTSEFPSELEEIACSLQNGKQSGVIRNQVIAELLQELSGYKGTIQKGDFLSHYKNRSAVIGKQVQFTQQNKTFLATAVNIDNTGGLVVRFGDGTEQTLTSGEISIKGDFSQ